MDYFEDVVGDRTLDGVVHRPAIPSATTRFSILFGNARFPM